MTITRAEAAMLGRRAQQPVKGPGDLLCVFVPGRLVNPLNASAWGWQKRSRTAKAWKQRVSNVLLENATNIRRDAWEPAPKVVTFTANTHNVMDGDGLQASLKPVRDALVICGVISGDADRDKHVFIYRQQIDRKHRGVTIRVALNTGA